MSLRKMDACRIFVKLCCFIGLISMVAYWVHKFLIVDRDIGVVDYELHETDIDLPTLSICIRNPFLDKKIRSVDSQLNEDSYLRYLQGNIDEVKFQDIEYENVSLDLNEYLLALGITYRNRSTIFKEGPKKRIDVIYNGMNYYFVKCFSHQLDKHERREVYEVIYVFNKTRLFNDLSDSVPKKERILLYVYYPNHFLMKVTPDELYRSSSTFVSIKDIEFIKARNTRRRGCMEQERTYDALVLKKHIEKIGCTAPYHGSYNSFPRCRNKTEMKNYLYDLDKAKKDYYPPACNRISKMIISYYAQSSEDHQLFYAVGYLNEWMKIIHQSKEVDIHSLIGNIGGYVGLFLGKIIIALWHHHVL